MTITYTHRCMIVDAGIVDTARQLAVAIAGEPAAGMWMTGLSPTGEEPATHYISSGMVESALVPYLEDASALAEAADISEQEAEQLLAKAHVSDGEPFSVMEELGLQIIQSSYSD